jgi:hypothetical protein
VPPTHGQAGGFHRATSDVDAVRRWWEAAPKANIGLPTGQPWPGGDGLYLHVLDFDVKSRPDLAPVARALLTNRLLAAQTWVAATRSGGAHVYVLARQATGIVPLDDAHGHVGELRGQGGYVLMPPSTVDGRPYVWLSPLADDGLPQGRPLVVDDSLEWAQGLLEAYGIGACPRAAVAPGRAWHWDGQPVPEGRRHDHLVSLAGRLRASGLSPESIEAALFIENERRCDPPLPEDEVRRIARSMNLYPPHPNQASRGVGGEVFSVFSQACGFSCAAPRPALMVHVPPFPLAVLPERVRRYVEEAAAGMGCPPDLVAVPLLAAAGATWGNKLSIRLTSRWEERAIVWAAVVAPPGSAKSPALEAALAPLVALQKDAYNDWQEAMGQWRKAQAARNGKGPPEPRPQLEHYFTTDVTMEAIARILGGSEEERSVTPGLAVTMDELAAWVKSFDAYHARGERQRWLSLWAGAAVKVDRATKGTAFIDRPAVCVVGGITPDCLPLLEAEAGQEDGFIDRILYAYPDARPMRFVDAPPPTVDLAPTFGELRACPEGEVHLSPSAREEFARFVDENAEAQEGESFRPLRRYRSKLPRHLARLVLVLHALHHPQAPAALPVVKETMAGAIALTRYFLAHAHRVLLEFGEGALARRVLELLSASGAMELGALYSALGGHVRAGELRAVRDFLVAQGLVVVTPVPPGPTGGRPGERWELAPGGENPYPCEKTEKTPLGDGELEEVL